MMCPFSEEDFCLVQVDAKDGTEQCDDLAVIVSKYTRHEAFAGFYLPRFLRFLSRPRRALPQWKKSDKKIPATALCLGMTRCEMSSRGTILENRERRKYGRQQSRRTSGNGTKRFDLQCIYVGWHRTRTDDVQKKKRASAEIHMRHYQFPSSSNLAVAQDTPAKKERGHLLMVVVRRVLSIGEDRKQAVYKADVLLLSLLFILIRHVEIQRKVPLCFQNANIAVVPRDKTAVRK